MLALFFCETDLFSSQKSSEMLLTKVAVHEIILRMCLFM